jgi:hypothetical protein
VVVAELDCNRIVRTMPSPTNSRVDRKPYSVSGWIHSNWRGSEMTGMESLISSSPRNSSPNPMSTSPH